MARRRRRKTKIVADPLGAVFGWGDDPTLRRLVELWIAARPARRGRPSPGPQHQDGLGPSPAAIGPPRGPTRRQIEALYYVDVCGLTLLAAADKLGGVRLQSVYALLVRGRRASRGLLPPLGGGPPTSGASAPHQTTTGGGPSRANTPDGNGPLSEPA